MNNSHKTIRTTLLKRSVITSLSGKSVTVITQIVAMPLAAGALGLERFGAYTMLVAAFLWTNMLYAAIGQALTLKIVSAHAVSERRKEAVIFSSGMSISVVLAFSLALIFYLVLDSRELAHLFHISDKQFLQDFGSATNLIACLVIINILFGLSESAHTGYQKQYVNSVMLMLANVISIIGLLIVQYDPSITNMVAAMFLPLAVSKVINFLYLTKNYSYIFPSIKLIKKDMLKGLIYLGSGFALVQVGALFYVQFSVIYVGAKVGLTNAAYFAAMVQVIVISGSVLIVFTQPLLPAIKDSLDRGDFEWIKRAKYLAYYRLVPYVVVASIIISYFGEDIISFLLKNDVEIEGTVKYLWALFFLIVAWEHICYIFLVGLGRVWLATILYLMGAVVMVIAGWFLVPSYGLNGAFLSMCLGPLVFTVFAYPIFLNRTLQKIISTRRECQSVEAV